MRAAYLLLFLAAISLSTIGDDVKPVWLSTLEEPEPVNFSLPVASPRPVFPSFVFESRVWGEGFVSVWSGVRP